MTEVSYPKSRIPQPANAHMAYVMALPWRVMHLDGEKPPGMYFANEGSAFFFFLILGMGLLLKGVYIV